MLSDLIGMFILPFLIFAASFLLFVHSKKKKKEAFNVLPIEQKKLELKRRDDKVVNIFTVIIPAAIYFTLQREGVFWAQAIFIGLFVGTVFKIIFSLSKR